MLDVSSLQGAGEHDSPPQTAVDETASGKGSPRGDQLCRRAETVYLASF